MNRFGNLNNKTPADLGNHNVPHSPGHLFRKKSGLRLIIGLTAVAIFFSLGFILSAYLNRPPELISQKDEITGLHDQDMPVRLGGDCKDGYYTFLVAGTDKNDYHTDTIMVISLDTAGNKANIVSVPRDTQVDVPRNPKKINSAYAVGGVDQLKEEIKSILGFSPQYYIVVDLEAFKKLVDAVDGVEYDIPQDMDENDPSQGLHIHLKQGMQILDGDKALQLVRYRGYPSADIGRMETQQHFLMALANKLLTVLNAPKITQFIDIFKQHVETDLSLREMQWFARKLMQLDTEKDLTVQTLPYSGFGDYRGHNYLYLAGKDVISMVNRTINPYTHDITLEDVKIIRLED